MLSQDTLSSLTTHFWPRCFFFFFFQNTVRLFPKRHNTEKNKTASNVLLRRTNIENKVYDVQTMQTKFARFRQKSSGC